MTFSVGITPERTMTAAVTSERTASLALASEQTFALAISITPLNLTAPTNLVATAVSSSEIDLTWTDNASEEDGYSIERSPDGSTGWAEIDTVGANVEAYSDTGLETSTEYFYRVRAYHDSTYGPYGEVASATTESSALPWQTYADLVVNTYGAAEVWPLVDVDSGVTVPAYVSTPTRDGTATSVTWQSGASPLTGGTKLTPYFDGALDSIDLFTASLAGLINAASTLSIRLLFQPASAGFWTDGNNHGLMLLYASATNYISMRKSVANGTLVLFAKMDNSNKVVTFSGVSGTGIFDVGLTLDKPNDQLIGYLNGSPSTPTTGLPSWTGGAFTQALLGTYLATPNMLGYLAFAMVWDGVVPPADWAAMYAAL